MTARALLLVAATAAATVAVAPPARAQHWRTLSSSRQLRDSGAVTVRIEYSAGSIAVRPAASALLYQMSLKYDGDRSEPLTSYDSARHTLALGIRSHSATSGRNDKEAGALTAELSARVPMDLSLELGAVQGDLQLGGLRLSNLALKGGAAELTLRFDQRNPDRLHTLSLDVGAADVKIVRAGNSGVDRVSANIGVGKLDLDLGGDVTRDVDVSANVALGEFTLRVPPEAGVRLETTTFLASVDKAGLVKREDGAWYTANFDSASRHVRVRVNTVLGGFTLARDSR